MANDDLVSYREQLSSDFGAEWDDLEDVISSMKREFSQSDRDRFRQCTNDSSLPEGDNIIECLQSVASDLGVAESFRRQINQADGLISALRSAGRRAAESNDVSSATRQAADFATAAELNRMCARGDYSDVEDEASDDAMAAVGGSIGSYQDCVTVSSEQAELRQSLKAAYGTN